MKCKRILCLLLSVILLLGTANITLASDQSTDENALYAMISTGIGSAEAYLREQLTQIHNDSGVGFGSDWAVITLLRGGKTVDAAILSAYYASLTETVKTWTTSVKPTNAAKAALGFTVSGKDISDIDGANLVNLISGNTGLSDGANELAYSLLALDAAKAEIPQDATWQKSDMIGALLGFQAENGGFGLVDATADTDMTAICIQALSPYRNDGTVETAIGKALTYLKGTISDDWDYADNPNTTAQVLLALSALAIDVTNPENGFGESECDNIVTALEKYRNPDGNGYLYGDSVNTIATYQIMQAYDAYRKAHKDGVSYWDFSTAGQAYNDLDGTESPAPDGTVAEPIDVFVTIADGGEIVTDKTGAPVAQTKVTVSDIDRDGTLTVNEALYAAHEVLYEGGADVGYSTFMGDFGLSLAKLWGRGTEGVAASAGYYRNHTGCYSLTDAVAEGDYITAFNYYDASYWSDAYAYFTENTVSTSQGSAVTLTLHALGYDADWNQVPAPYSGASVKLLGTDGEVWTTAAEGKVEIPTALLAPGTYYAVAYTDAKSIVPAVCKIEILGVAAEPIDVFVTIADGGDIVTDKTGAPVAQTKVTVSDIDRDGTLTVNEALYAAHEVLYEGGADVGYSTFMGDYGLSLAKLWGRGTEGVAASAGYYRNHTGCYSLTDAVAEGDYITAFNYYDTSYYSDTYAYFGDDAITAKEGSTITLTLYALGYDEDWNQVPAPHPGASVSVLGNDGFEEVLTAADGKVQIKLDGTFHTGTYYIKAYKGDHSLVPAISKLTVTKKTAPVITPVAKNLSITVKVMTHGSGCNNSFTYRNNAGQYNPLVSTRVSLEKNKTVFDALKAALESEGIDYTEAGGYVSEIGGYKEFDHGPRSGWMFTVDGVHQTTGCRETKLTKNSTVIWYYTDDYTKERGSDASREEPPKGNDKPDFGLRGKHADITYKEITNQGKTFADIINCIGKAEIEALAERGIINGKTAEIYDPYAQMTRAEFATIMVNALGLPEKDGVRFEDVKDGDWYAPYIKTAYHYGIINGVSEHLFNPEGKVTAEEAATMIMRAATLCGMQTDLDKAAASDILEKFEDCEAIADWSVSSVGFCVKEGILESTQQKIRPREKLSRDVIAVMIYKMLGKARLI
ncbi:MAG: S-layer homology domain-containing protein [Clostridia bacterium]|nr:S-layer homology domain-containing protein [Clostridia bacterium]